MADATDDDWVPIALVGRPHGVRGELRAHPFDKQSTLLLELDEVLVRFVDGPRKGEEHEVSIDGARAGNDAILLKLHGVVGRDRAVDVRGAQLCARRSDFPKTDEDEFYAVDIIGAQVLDPEGQALGTVREFSSYPSVDILLIEGPRGRYEVPLVDAYVESVDAGQKRVVLRTLEGLDPTPIK